MNALVYITSGQPVKVRDKVPGGRVEKFYAIIEAFDSETVSLCYNGEVRTIKVKPAVIGAEWREIN